MRRAITKDRETFISEWIHVLRTTKRKQGRYRLATKLENGKYAYCCLGIACEVAGLPKRESGFLDSVFYGRGKGENTFLPRELSELLDVSKNPSLDCGDYNRDRNGHYMTTSLTVLNDDEKFTFPQIADMIEYFGLK